MRRAAARQGLRLCKSRRRDPLATDFECWALFGRDGSAVYGMGDDGRFRASLEEIGLYLGKPIRREMTVADGNFEVMPWRNARPEREDTERD